MIKAIEYRMNQLELFNQQLVDIKSKSGDDTDLMHIYFENEARLNELSTLLEYIKTPKVAKNEVKNSI